MSRVGISGHQDIPASAVAGIEARVRDVLLDHGSGGLLGIGSLAAGADQLFARCVLDVGGTLGVVVPCAGYESTFAGDAERHFYETTLGAAASVRRLPFRVPSQEAFMAAGLVVADWCDLLIAVWDGRPARGFGGTADVVGYARSIGREVTVVWPDGVRRP